jgi:hypothetical protein
MERASASPSGRAGRAPSVAEVSHAQSAMLCATHMERRNALTVCAASLLDDLEVSLGHAHELATSRELDSVGQYIEEARRYLDTVRALHRKALDEFNAAQGE